jgi:hypothetical protein
LEVFDPNFGIIRSTDRAVCTKELWPKYTALNMVINRWWILSRVSATGVETGVGVA